MVFGGAKDDERTPLDDLWSFSLSSASWSPLTNGKGPKGTQYASAAGTSTGTFYLFTVPNETWAYTSGAGWTKVLNIGGITPAARFGQGVAWDPNQGRFLLIGGSFTNDLWAFTPEPDGIHGYWTRLGCPSGPEPQGRMDHVTVYDNSTNYLLVYGGANGEQQYLTDLWGYRLPQGPWVQLSDGGPSPRICAAAVFDPLGKRLLIFGGEGPDGQYLGDLWAWQSPRGPWSQLHDGSGGPGGRQDLGVGFDQQRNQLLVFGGLGEGWAYLNDLWAFSLGGSSVGLPPPLADGPSRPKLGPLLGMPRLGSGAGIPAAGARRLVRAVTEVHAGSGVGVDLHYDVEFADGVAVHSLNSLLSAQSAECSRDGSLKIVLSTAADAIALRAALRPQHVVVGGREWGCRDAKGHPQAILHRVHSATVNGTAVHVRGRSIQYQDIFKHANISFTLQRPLRNRTKSAVPGAREVSTAASPGEAAGPVSHPRIITRHPSNDPVRFGGFFDWVGDLVDTVAHELQHLAQDVEDVVKTTVRAVEFFATGDLTIDPDEKLADINWNYDSATGKAKQQDIHLGNGFVCHECFANFEVDLKFDIVISNFALQHLAVWLEGDVDFHVDAMFYPKAYRGNGTQQVADLQFPVVTFYVGPVPVVINITMPVNIGYVAHVDMAGTHVHAQSGLSGYIKKGVLYDPSTGDQTHWINEENVQSYGQLMYAANVTAALQLFLFPVVTFQCDHIGGPTVGFKGSVELISSYDPSSEVCPGGLFAQINFGLNTALGADVDVEIDVGGKDLFSWKRAWPSMLSNTKLWPILSGCVGHALQGGRTALVPMPSNLVGGVQPVAASVVYRGFWNSSNWPCPGATDFPKVEITLQIQSSVDPHLLSHQQNAALWKHGGATGGMEVRLQHETNWHSSTASSSFNPFAVLHSPFTLTDGYLVPTATPDQCKDSSGAAACFTFLVSTSPDSPVEVPWPNFAATLSADMSTYTLTDSSPGSCYGPWVLSRMPGAAPPQGRNHAKPPSQNIFV